MLCGSLKLGIFDRSNRSPKLDSPRSIHVKDINSRSANGGESLDYAERVLMKVLIPMIDSRIEKTGQLAAKRIEPCKVGPFVPVAPRTRDRQIDGSGLTSMLTRNDMFNLKQLRENALRYSAILTTTIGSTDNKFSKFSVRAHRRYLSRTASVAALARNKAITSIASI